MPLHDFHGPVTNDKTAVFLKYANVTADSNLVKSVRDAAYSVMSRCQYSSPSLAISARAVSFHAPSPM